jgi:hypothetical protein
MAKLFIFGIGGTGSRVIKALTMLLASGVKMENTDTIVPIIIDPDSANGDLTRTEEILRLYKDIYQKGNCRDTTFFNTKINSLDEIGEGGFVSDNFRFEIGGVKDALFKDFIDYGSLDYNNKAFTSLLFSKNNLNANMDVGFKGNPNIGSVVLNKFRETSFFKKFAQSFGQNDRVFIISSIFGGTGASGFPLILKNIRGAENPIPNYASLQNAKIGAITVLPYFSINNIDNQTEIESDTFISKTKAALSYYAKNVSGTQSVNALYYIGDEFTDNKVEGADGATKQKNNAHFIELASALAIVDFMSKSDSELFVIDGKVSSPKYYEYGLKNETSKITFKDLANISHDNISKPLTQLALFDLFFKNHFVEAETMAFAKNGNNKLQMQHLDKRFTADLNTFNNHFEEWLKEMAKGSVSFEPINLNVSKKGILDLAVGSPETKNKWNPLEVKGDEYFIQNLNKVDKSEGLDSLEDSNKKLLSTFSKATNRTITEKISL